MIKCSPIGRIPLHAWTFRATWTQDWCNHSSRSNHATQALLGFVNQTEFAGIVCIDLLESKLGTNFDSKIVVSPNVEKWKKKLFFTKLSNIFDLSPHEKIKFTYQTRSDVALHRNCVKFITNLCKTTSEGVLVFLPSYSVLEIFKRTISSNQMLKSSLAETKKVFYEEKGAVAKKMFKQYQVVQRESNRKECCSNKNSKGAVLFIVIGGKFSEGIDFKNELARLILVVGVPLANFFCNNIKSKKMYLSEMKAKRVKSRKTCFCN